MLQGGGCVDEVATHCSVLMRLLIGEDLRDLLGGGVRTGKSGFHQSTGELRL